MSAPRLCNSTFEGERCCLLRGHDGLHQSQPCDGTCDSCGCIDWTDQDAADEAFDLDEWDEEDDWDWDDTPAQSFSDAMDDDADNPRRIP